MSDSPHAPHEPLTAEKVRRLPWSLAGNAANAVYSQFTFFGAVFVLFLSQLGLTKSTIGTLLALIPFFGLIALFITPTVARLGYKRVYITCFTIRKLITLALLLSPWILQQFGPRALLWTVVIIISVFSLFRAIAITGSHPWEQEYIPDSVRGKYAAVNQILTGLTGFAAINAAATLLGTSPALQDFGLLFAIGTAVGLASMLAFTQVPGGAPEPASRAESASPRGMLSALRDPNLSNFLIGMGLVTLAATGLGSFVTLFMREEVGLDAGQVIRLQGAGLAGGLVTSYLWGWAADRYGSRPVAMLGVSAKVLLPVFWFVLPRGSPWSLPIAVAAAVWQGMANMGWTIGSNRLLFTDVVPPERRAGYMAVHYAWLSTVEGLSQLYSGRMLDLTAGWQHSWLGLSLDRYSLLFAVGICLPLLGSVFLRRVRAAGNISAAQLAGMLLRGRPWLAARSLLGHRLARNESAAVSATELLGQARSPLTVDELVGSLSDPRFNVRFEAVLAMTHVAADQRITRALVETLAGSDPALGSLAAWALGRGGDRNGIPALRDGLASPYRSVRAHCARSLASLGDRQSAADLAQWLVIEPDEELQVAYAAALGMLRYEPAVTLIGDLLWRQARPEKRMELALALARITGEEHFFLQLRRQSGDDLATALAPVVSNLRRKLAVRVPQQDLAQRLALCAEALARHDLDQGVGLLVNAAAKVSLAVQPQPAVKVLHACEAGMRAFGAERVEYLLLALHAMHAIAAGPRDS